MRLHSDIDKNKELILESIRKFGYSAEHNYFHYKFLANKKWKPVFAEIDGSKGVMALLNEDKKIWKMVGGVIAPEKERIGTFTGFLEKVLEEKGSKIFIEVETDFRKEILRELEKKYKVSSTNYILHWPVYELSLLDENLNGKKWKKIRNIRNRFKSMGVKSKDDLSESSESMLEVLEKWLAKRPHNDSVDVNYYRNVIKNNFEGFDIARAFELNGKISSISAGWKVPNSGRFYWSIGIHDYSHKELSEFLNFEDLTLAKKTGYEFAELGGSDKNLLMSKRKFNPSEIYKTHIFSLRKS